MRRPALLAVVVVAALALVGVGATAATPSPVAPSDNETVTAEFDPDTVTAGANTTLLVNTSSDTVAIDSPDISDERLHRVVEGEPSGGEVVANVSDGRVNVRFGECAPTGEYEFVVSESTMTPNAPQANLTVVAPADTEPTFRRSVLGVSSGVTARIAIDTGCAARGTLHVGSRSAGFLANTTVESNRSDAVVSLDTDQTDSPEALFAGGPNTTLRNTTLAQPADPPLPLGEYDLTLTVNGTETDVAVLNVSEAPDGEGPTTPTAGTAIPTITESSTPTTPTAGPEPPTDSPTPVVDGTPTATPTGGDDGTPTGGDDGTPTGGDDGTPPVTSSDGQSGFGVVVAIISIMAILSTKNQK